ncbi:hypothetical protein [Actinoallomurus iriomotensis]|uniref:Uncharacterized protein n=1 Tax=Actinoallomurus iriomotensis TaxID=478107 RepID=A0A9W6RM44_9ACTN|nr:hypothetical protein [Actinoallomurus iriomotensis]GLY78436.1 hypothetical protein Airi01_067030 [Actinoallomurus iriomotensis]
MDLPADLQERLDRLHAAVTLDQDLSDVFLAKLFPGEPVWIACGLLVAGIETPAVIALACESPTRLVVREGRPLVQRLLSELALDAMGVHQAGWITAREIARQIETGTLDEADGGHLLLGLWETCHEPDEMRPLRGLLDAWENTPFQHRDRERFGLALRRLSRAVIRGAPARLQRCRRPTGDG